MAPAASWPSAGACSGRRRSSAFSRPPALGGAGRFRAALALTLGAAVAIVSALWLSDLVGRFAAPERSTPARFDWKLGLKAVLRYAFVGLVLWACRSGVSGRRPVARRGPLDGRRRGGDRRAPRTPGRAPERDGRGPLRAETDVHHEHSIFFGLFNALLTRLFGPVDERPVLVAGRRRARRLPRRRDRAARRARRAPRLDSGPRRDGARRLPLLRASSSSSRRGATARTRPAQRAERPRGLRRLPPRRHQGEHPASRREVPADRRGVLLLHLPLATSAASSSSCSRRRRT